MVSFKLALSLVLVGWLMLMVTVTEGGSRVAVSGSESCALSLAGSEHGEFQ